jgi:predicted kinase
MGQQTLIMTKGLPASGKTTWAREQVAAYPNEIVRVNKDDLRAMIFNNEHSNDREKFIQAARDAIVERALASGRSVIVDDTNFAPKHETRLRQLAERYNVAFRIEDQFLSTPVEECVKRDVHRGEKVGRKVIYDMYNRYLYTPPVAPEFDPALPDAIIVDIDGTLALRNGRGPFEYEKCSTDLPNKPVIDMLDEYLNSDAAPIMIFFSGREQIGETFSETERWLRKHLPFLAERNYLLKLREYGDHRKDAIVKREMYDVYIAGQYNVRFVIDDREQVVRMWRQDLGFTVLDVAGHTF